MNEVFHCGVLIYGVSFGDPQLVSRHQGPRPAGRWRLLKPGDERRMPLPRHHLLSSPGQPAEGRHPHRQTGPVSDG